MSPNVFPGLLLLIIVLSDISGKRLLLEKMMRPPMIVMIEVMSNSPIIWVFRDHFFQAIRKATAWYAQHLKLTRPKTRGHPTQLPYVVLLTEDAANREKALKEGITVMSG